MSEICPKDYCTACGACANICPKGCITWVKDNVDTLYPQIDEGACVHCDACRRACPNNIELEYHRPIKTFATWSLDKENRRTSASGGITSVFYRYALRKGGFTCGAELSLDNGVNYIKLEDEEDIKMVKNSKYVFSHTNDIYIQARQALKNGRFVFFVGLPCQLAGFKSFLGKLADSENLLTADIICHGVSNEDYLFQYIHHIEQKKKRKTLALSFRDPAYGTESYVFTLRANTNDSVQKQSHSCCHSDEKKVFYKQNHYGLNLYYIGYMNSLHYRENCYHCRYARTERISDLTFGDFDGLGKEMPFNYGKAQVSMCLVNTPKGMQHLQEVANNLFMEERTLDEAVKPQQQLKGPAKKHPMRQTFLNLYCQSHDFAYASRISLKREIKRNLIYQIKQVLVVKPMLTLFSQKQRNRIKTFLGR